MKPFLVSEISQLINGNLVSGSDDLIITNCAYYVKKMKKTNTILFIKRITQNELQQIEKCIPCAVVTDRSWEPLKSIEKLTVIMVQDLNKAYNQFVDYYRSLFEIPVICVTGTCGKTTTKDLIKHIASHYFNVTGTQYSANGRTGHFNNLLRIDETIEVAVFEAAVGKPGDILYSSKYFKPTIGIITNIGAAHLDYCKTPENYIQAKAEMVTALGNNGLLIINSDDENTKKINLDNFKGRIVYFGIHNPSNFKASNVRYGENGMDFVLTFNGIKHQLFMPGYGEHQVYNALAALAAVHELGIGLMEASKLLRTFKKLQCHMEITKGISGSMIIDDTWNSNPTSIRAALNALSGIRRGKNTIVVLGVLKSLGDKTTEYSKQVGEMIADVGVDELITIGTIAEDIAKSAFEKGMHNVHAFPDTCGVEDFIKNILNKDTILLAKCSSSDYDVKTLITNLKVQ